MKLPNWFRILWWIVLLAGVSTYLYQRYPELILGKSTAADVVVFIVWIALWLIPIASELNIFGFHIKKEVESVKKDFTEKIESLRNEITNSLELHSQISPQFNLQMPATDSQLPKIEEQVKAAVHSAMERYGVNEQSLSSPEIQVNKTDSYLFSVRHNIERELRRIYTSRFPDDKRRRYTSVIAISKVLVSNELVSPNLAHAIQEVYRACSAAIHGEEVSEAQATFVKDVAPELLVTLRAIL